MNGYLKSRKTAAASAVTTLLALAAPAHAQSTAAAAKPDDGNQIQEVVVTAQKRASTDQKTAAAVTVFDARSLEKNGVQTLQDLTKLAPAVSLGQASSNVIVTMRGVSSRDTTEIGDPAVSISSDGFYIQRPTGFLGALFDLERVEVLRGPQGTLYGRSATGGAINFITAKPEKEFSGRLGAGFGSYGLINTEGMVNMPLGEQWAARVAFQTSRHKGYRVNEGPARAGDDDDSNALRVHLQWTPSKQFKLLLTAQSTHTGGVGPTYEGVPLVGATNNNFRPDLDVKGTSHGVPNQFIDATTETFQVNASYDLGFASLIYSGGHRDMKLAQLRDLDGLLGSGNYFSVSEHPKDTSHELRMVSSDEGRLKWQFGGYYFTEDNPLLNLYQSYTGANAPTNIFVFNYNVTATSSAVFGQASYDLMAGLSVDAGLRRSRDHKTRSGFQNTGTGDVQLPGDSTNQKTTYHVGLNWQLSPTRLVYGKYSTGYKAGGFSSIISGSGSGATVTQVSYNPETITAFEIGSKNQLLDRRLQLNASLFTYDYKDQQVSISQNGPSFTANAGKSRINGAEVEMVARPTQDDRADASIAYLDSKFKEFCRTRDAKGVCTVDFTGNVSVQAPKWQLNAGVEHAFRAFGGSLTARVQTHYESMSYLGAENFARQKQPSFWRSDAMLTYADPSGKWTLQGYVRNLENANVITMANASFGSYNYALAAPRTWGVKLVSHF